MVSIYIRTYKLDIAWLDFCLQSIHRNLKGWDEIVVYPRRPRASP